MNFNKNTTTQVRHAYVSVRRMGLWDLDEVKRVLTFPSMAICFLNLDAFVRINSCQTHPIVKVTEAPHFPDVTMLLLAKKQYNTDL